MSATTEQLKARWQTDDGKERLKKVIQAAKKHEDWEPLLEGFPYVEDVENGRDFRVAYLRETDVSETDLSGADLRGASLGAAQLTSADLRGANLDCVTLTRTTNFSLAQFNRRTSFLGTDISKVNWWGNPLLKRHIEDQQWVESWRLRNRGNRLLWWPLWSLTCDCGRSIGRWIFCSLVLAGYFGFIYLKCGKFFLMRDGMTLADAPSFTAFYYSIVTFTTLGFGDVTPHPTDVLMQLYVTMEVVMGYIMLGGLISIFANKLARRA